MKLHDQDVTGSQTQPPVSHKAGQQHGWMTTIGAIIGVLLIVGLTAMLLTWWKINQPSTAGGGGQWTQVLSGYTVDSLTVAPGNSSVLYACASRAAAGSDQHTLLRSADGGTHWQDIGQQAQIVNLCQIAINPTNSNDLYVVNKAASASSPATLRHSTDGGQTWTTITPTLQISGNQGQSFWNVQQLSMAGTALFAIQPMPRVFTSPKGQGGATPSSITFAQARLVQSTDGGKIWTVVDSYFDQSIQGVYSYAVDPTHPQTIYELVSPPWQPVLRVPPPGNVIPAYSTQKALYKTTDGGATWSRLLSNLPYSSKVQLASNAPNIVYAGGSIGPVPLVGQPANTGKEQYASPGSYGNFRLQVSTDSGAHWSSVTKPTQFVSVQDWFVSPEGGLYASSGYSVFGTPTVTLGTAVVKSTVTLPQEPTSGTASQGASTTGTGAATSLPNNGSSAQVPTNGTPLPPTPGTSAQLARYDPNTSQWLPTIQAPPYGTLITVTAGTQGHSILWVRVYANNQPELYRYIV
jgi:hypothetical protein